MLYLPVRKLLDNTNSEIGDAMRLVATFIVEPTILNPVITCKEHFQERIAKLMQKPIANAFYYSEKPHGLE